jgi:hypothetical protein
MFLQIAFKVFPRTLPNYMKRTFSFPECTNIVVCSDVFNGEQFKAAAPSVSARVLLYSGDVFQSQTPDI